MSELKLSVIKDDLEQNLRQSEIAPPPETGITYLQQRLNKLGITDQLNRHIFYKPGEVAKVHETTVPWFEADTEGNVVINYFSLTGQPYHWKKEETKWPRPYTRTRLRVPGHYRRQELKTRNQKYFQEKGSAQFPYFTPGILKKYKACKECILPDGKSAPDPIETLFAVEGEFKAFKGDMHGLDIIGIPSIHGFYNGDVRGRLHEDIQELIITCQVHKIVFLVDADLLTLKWEANKDLAKRAESFYSSIKLFRESLQLLIDDSKVKLELVYFMHINTRYANEAKGLDDLLCTYSSVVDEIKKDLLEFQFARKYFAGRMINDPNKDMAQLRKYLGLTDEQEFYETYKEFIGDREFRFRQRRYEYDKEAKQVKFVRHEDADRFMRIGPDWFKIVTKTDKYGIEFDELKVWKISEITRDYKKYPDFLDQVQKYDDFTNEPCWNGNYQRVIKGCYNLCWPIRWDRKPGEFPATEKFLKHIFGGDGTLTNNITGDTFTIALDWLTIFHQQPKQALPVIVLVSKENETGKSTFMKWLRTVYGSNNAVILSNEEFKMKFNGHYISKTLIQIDEGFLDVDKRAEKERLKKLITSDTAYIEFKGADLKLINYYAKIVMSSNDAERVMKIEEGETRWFVIKVPMPNVKDPDLEQKMKDEIPAWLDFLGNRQVFHKRESRLWFNPEYIITDQFKTIVDATKNRLDRIFEDWIAEMFTITGKSELEFSRKFITQQIADGKKSKYAIDDTDIKTYLNSKGMELSPVKWIRSPQLKPENYSIDPSPEAKKAADPQFDWVGYTARAYTFKREDWIKQAGQSEQEVESIVASQPTKSSDDLPF